MPKTPLPEIPAGWGRGVFRRIGTGAIDDQYRPDLPIAVTEWRCVVERTAEFVIDFYPAEAVSNLTQEWTPGNGWTQDDDGQWLDAEGTPVEAIA